MFKIGSLRSRDGTNEDFSHKPYTKMKAKQHTRRHIILKLVRGRLSNLLCIWFSDLILLCALNLIPENLAAFRVIGKQVVNYHLLRRLAHPLEQRKVSKLIGTEDLEHFDGLVTDVLYEVAHISRHDTHITRDIVECSSSAFRGENSDTSATFNEKGPFVGIGVPMHFPDRTGLDNGVSGRHSLRDGEVFRVGDTNFSSACLLGFLVQHLVGELVLRFLHSLPTWTLRIDGAWL
jgi:hypothetical protein